MDFNAWIDFTFGMTSDDSLIAQPLSPGDGFPFSPEELITHLLRFFHDPKAVVRKIPYENIVAAFRIMPSIDGYMGILALPQIDILLRNQLAMAHFSFFRDLFWIEDYSGTGFMWWEHLPGAAFKNGPRVFEDKEICRELVRVCENLWTLSSEQCQLCALHGLNEFYPYVFDDWMKMMQNKISEVKCTTSRVEIYAREVGGGNAP